MPIAVDIDVMLARRKMSVGELADCEALECQPGDLLRWEAEDVADEMSSPGVGATTPGATGP
jgi:putative transcriptional regulator